MKFKDRNDAAEKLSKKLMGFKNSEVLLLALPRGGIVIAYKLASLLSLPFDILVVRKIGAFFNPEFAIGAICLDEIFLSEEAKTLVSPEELQKSLEIEKQELQRREALYRKGKKSLDLKDKDLIIVDDGMATGATMHVAILAARKKQPKRVFVAIPVASKESVLEVAPLVDGIFFVETPPFFQAVGEFYEEFDQVSDDEVIAYMKERESFSK